MNSSFIEKLNNKLNMIELTSKPIVENAMAWQQHGTPDNVIDMMLDMYYENGAIKTSFEKHASTDPSLKGIRKLYKENKAEAIRLADEIIKNAYRILLTRGVKGCVIYCVDKNLNDYIKKLLKNYK